MSGSPLTPHGPEADACLAALIDRGVAILRRERLLPPETLAHYLIGDPAVGAGWVAQEGETWVPWETPRLVFLLPPGFEAEVTEAATAAAARQDELCRQVGYAMEFYWATEHTLAEPAQAHLALELATRRRLRWSFGHHDPLPDAALPRHATLAARQLFLDQGPRLEELAAWLPMEIFGLHPGIVRLAFIRAVEVLADLGEVVLISQGAMAATPEERIRAITELAARDQVLPSFARLYRTVLSLRTRQAHPRLPDWDALRELMREVPVWARHVAHVYLGAEVVAPPA